MNNEHREPSRTYVRFTPPPRYGMAKAHRGPRITYPQLSPQRFNGRLLTPLGGILVGLGVGLACWALIGVIVWRVMM